MVKYNDSDLDLLFYALSDKTRRAILHQLSSGESPVTQLAEPHDQSLAGISKHLKVLERAHLIKKTKEGRVISCSADLEPLSAVYQELEALGAFWRERLDSLETFLTTQSKGESHDNGSKPSKQLSKGYRKKNSKR